MQGFLSRGEGSSSPLSGGSMVSIVLTLLRNVLFLELSFSFLKKGKKREILSA